MRSSCSYAQMRELDRATIAAGTPSLVLMKRAGQALADCVQSELRRLNRKDVLFVCGGGNNGGDGFVAAQILLNAGADVAVLCIADRFSADCAAVGAEYRGKTYGRIPARKYSVVVDCLFGTGLSREIDGENAMLVDYINASGGYVIACDLPSGLKEGGVASEHCVGADRTVTMGRLKNALVLLDGADVSGEIDVADIGIDGDVRGAEVWDGSDVEAYFRKKKSNTHKGSFGTAAILAGDAYSGAAFLSAGACLKSGAGYTKLFVSEQNYPYFIGKFPACILQRYSEPSEAMKSDCLAVGMGMGASRELYGRLRVLLQNYTGTLVLDADALNSIAEYGVGILSGAKCGVILTPHPKELSRLTGKSVHEIMSGGVECLEETARMLGVTLVFKTNRTVVTNGTRTVIVGCGSPSLAKGGSGDVLSGLLAGTIARGVPVFEACCVASVLLALTGEEAEKQMGSYAPEASDFISLLPCVMRRLER